MSFPFEKPPGQKPFNITSSCVSETDWDAIDAMKDDDIVPIEECSEMQSHDFERGRLLFNGRTPTQEEIEEGRRIILQYHNRSQGAKSGR
ncbi:hypothetical protein ACN9MU_22690 [Pseudoduganella sp. R-32]|uniref:hypothetical protein n=1 Tax=Pseudoduganella sp. R-32 TaxID=3404061 RepID=UPI003CF5216E